MRSFPARPRVAVAVSGGVDSLCALLLLKRQGYEVFALHGLFLPEAGLSPMLKAACDRLKVEIFTADMINAFSGAVIGTFARNYAAGLTPNPCVACNRHIKFGALLDIALALGADSLATGHYVDKYFHNGRWLPRMARDTGRDQSYFLGQVNAGAFQRAFFPLATLHKRECRKIVAEAGLVAPEPKESQDICFAHGDWSGYLRKMWAGQKKRAPGPVVLMDKNGGKKPIGAHDGNLWKLTIGQRKGIGLPWREPLYVVGKNMAENTIFVAVAGDASSAVAEAKNMNFFLKPEYWPQKAFARLRSSQRPAPCRVFIHGDNARIEFDAPRMPGAPGQLAAIYNEDGALLGSGIIDGDMAFSGCPV